VNRVGLVVSSLLVLLALLSSTLFVVDQRQFGVGLCLRPDQGGHRPEYNFKLPPLFQNVSHRSRLLTLDSIDRTDADCRKAACGD
jgi:membrane protease subunit HflC